jgi:hypothetical protein
LPAGTVSRAPWSGPSGWIAQLKVHAALHNHAGLYNAEFNPPAGNDANNGFASGAWFLGPDGATLAQMPSSTQRMTARSSCSCTTFRWLDAEELARKWACGTAEAGIPSKCKARRIVRAPRQSNDDSGANDVISTKIPIATETPACK